MWSSNRVSSSGGDISSSSSPDISSDNRNRNNSSSSSESEISFVAPQSPVNSNIMSKYVDYFYRQPTCTYYTYYDYLVVIDFEATCDNTRNENPRPIRHERPEIIQFPAILVNVRTMEVVGIFNSIVKPVEAPILSDFCTRLTGITQSMVNKAPTFPTVLRRFETWLKSYELALNNQEYGHSFAIVTDGSYDLAHFLYKQCIISQIPYPSYASRWVNIRTIFTNVYRRPWVRLTAALEYLGLSFKGRAHNGLDDSKNICIVLMQLLSAGSIVYQTEKILLRPEEQERNEERILNDKSAGKYDLATVAPVSSKEYEHICVYSTDIWSTHRCVPPEVTLTDTDFPPIEASYDSGIESMGMVSGTESTCSSTYYQASTSGSCESIASGCSNKENSIPLYIPTSPTASKPGGNTLKNRASSVSRKDVAVIVGANGAGSDSTGGSVNNETAPFTSSSSGKAGRRKNRRKDHHHHGTSSSASSSFIKASSDESVVVVNSVGTQTLNGNGSSSNDDDDVSLHHLRHRRLKTKTILESAGTQATHLQPLVSDLRNEE